MAPLPKPKGQRVKRGAQPKWVELPAEGRGGRAPKLPVRDEGWSDSVVAWWKVIWASPMAAVWLDADVDGLVRLASLKDDFAAGRRGAVALPHMQALEDRFGLNPKSRRALQWEVSKAEAVAGSVVSLVKPVVLEKDPRKSS